MPYISWMYNTPVGKEFMESTVQKPLDSLLLILSLIIVIQIFLHFLKKRGGK